MVHDHQGMGSSPIGLSEQERTKLRKRLRKLDRLITRVDWMLKWPLWAHNSVEHAKRIGWRNRWDETRRLTRLRLKGYGV